MRATPAAELNDRNAPVGEVIKMPGSCESGHRENPDCSDQEGAHGVKHSTLPTALHHSTHVPEASLRFRLGSTATSPPSPASAPPPKPVRLYARPSQSELSPPGTKPTATPAPDLPP